MLTVPPTFEPFTLIEAQLRAGLSWDTTALPADPRNALLTGFIMAARSQVERDTGVALPVQTHVVSLARHAYSSFPIRLPWRPVQTVTIDDPDGEWDASQYVLDPSSVEATPATLALVPYGSWPEGLQATIVVGFDTVEELQQQAPGLYHAVGLLLAHYATLGRDLASAAGAELVPMGYREAIAPYELVTLA